jgi:hypothetical protein
MGDLSLNGYPAPTEFSGFRFDGFAPAGEMVSNGNLPGPSLFRFWFSR